MAAATIYSSHAMTVLLDEDKPVFYGIGGAGNWRQYSLCLFVLLHVLLREPRRKKALHCSCFVMLTSSEQMMLGLLR